MIRMKAPVKNSVRVEIAEIRFDISGDDSVGIREDDPFFDGFITEDSGNGPDVRLSISFPSTKESMRKRGVCVYDNDKMWTMYRDEEHFWIENHPPGADRLIWLAKTNADFSEIDLYCPDDLKNTYALTNNIRYPLLQIVLMHFLAQREGALVHAAGATIRGEGCLFPGISGAGKSTLTNRLANSSRVKRLSDDRMVVRKTGGDFKTFGTPWPGDSGIAENEGAPLSAIFFIAKNPENRIVRIPPGQALERLMPVTSIPWYDRDGVTDILDFLGETVREIPAFELRFKPGAEVAELVEDFVAEL